MTQIDWSKSPEGATHYSVCPDAVSKWLRADGISTAWWDAKDAKWVSYTIEHYAAKHAAGAIPRPADNIAWNGAGLPPVGTVCEVNYQEWRRCEVFAHKVEGDNDPDVLFSYTKDNGEPAWNWVRDPSRFRPIRTPEQIAAEEREKTITKMWALVRTDSADIVSIQRQVCADLYDAGLRFPDGGDA